ncbi:SDR family NAD(P)-dependent oxidoreductase [Sphingomonas crocodyli]|uniref:SDR family oxidoreductase n=1 Tax=Sphingomonas crocodyli TaxID=1979270 RepID=A0A437M086_9SPHN|nr:SDR family oxidoreductase [Sphingomonas crocodyli]RVT91097.1 SDR family oxidoreductase [Sphingomonas crocodyli]
MDKKLQGRRALILGVAPGNLGAVIARAYVEQGAVVTVAGRRPDAVQAVADEIGAHWQPCDIADGDSIDAAVSQAASAMGGIDIGVNTVGWGLLKPFLETTRDDLDRMAAIQFSGPFQFFQALLRAMPDGGSIIQISSVTATIMFDDHAAYMGTKAGMDHIIRCIAHEFGDRGIRANSIAPGGIADTPMSGGGMAFPPVHDLYMREIPLRRPGVAADVATAAVWLASDDASFVTGQTLHVSGGQTLRRNPSLAEVVGCFSPPPA